MRIVRLKSENSRAAYAAASLMMKIDLMETAQIAPATFLIRAVAAPFRNYGLLADMSPATPVAMGTACAAAPNTSVTVLLPELAIQRFLEISMAMLVGELRFQPAPPV